MYLPIDLPTYLPIYLPTYLHHWSFGIELKNKSILVTSIEFVKKTEII
jgi:hypothetical protein